MEIEALRLTVSDKDLNEMIKSWMPEDVPVSAMKARIKADGISLSGTYHYEANLPLLGKKTLNVDFETLWELGVTKDKIVSTLSDFEAAGLPAGVLKGVLMKTIATGVEEDPTIEVSDESVAVDLDRLLADKGIPIKTRIKALDAKKGSLTVVAGKSA